MMLPPYWLQLPAPPHSAKNSRPPSLIPPMVSALALGISQALPSSKKMLALLGGKAPP